jgi:glycine C-acetyltransferase
MRGDTAPLAEIMALAEKYDAGFAENVLVVIDDSHGVGAYGPTGRGTEEVAAVRADLLVATLGKALGVNGGYVAASPTIVEYLRQQSPLYVYSNPITAGEAAAASRALDMLDSPAGLERLGHLKAMTERFEAGLIALGFETISSPHPIVPLLLRHTERTSALVAHLRQNGILATGLNYPVVPKGDQTIRFQISADHTPHDIAEALDVLGGFSG